jgi:hypothetical protein
MNESEMEYRGSKSVSDLKIPTSHIKKSDTVKEQRVDGSWCNNIYVKKIMHLRCTLMNFERGYQIKVLSNQKRFYTDYGSNQLNP